MNIKVGPFYDGCDEEMLPITSVHTRFRRPTAELLESVKLRPTYFSFAPTYNDRSPSAPEFRFPQYNCYSLQGDLVASPTSNTTTAFSSPRQFGQFAHQSDRKRKYGSLWETVAHCSNFFFGVRCILL